MKKKKNYFLLVKYFNLNWATFNSFSQLKNFEVYGELTSCSRSPICINSVNETEYLENNKSQKLLENTNIQTKTAPPTIKLNER